MSDIILLSNLAPPSSRVLQALDNAGLHTVDLLTLDVFEIHRRTQLSVIDVQNLVKDVINALNECVPPDSFKTAAERLDELEFLTTGDEMINELLGGGIPTGSLTEVTGESGLGKSQLCLQLCIHVQLPSSMGGLDAGAIYIGTESSLATIRLEQIASSLSATLLTSPPTDVPTEDIEKALETLATHGDQVYYYNCSDLEAQEHIVTYQLPVVLSRYKIGLIILDSVTSNLRAEFGRISSSQIKNSQPAQMAQRSKDLRKLAGTLKDLAIQHNVAVVAINQVTDNFKRTSSQSAIWSQDEELLSSDYQSRWFDGLIDEYGVEMSKKPALGLVWANLITSRIMLVRDNPSRTRMRVVFSPYAKPGSLVYAISTEVGIHAAETGHEEQTRPLEVQDDLDFVKSDDFRFSDYDLDETISQQPDKS